MRHLPLNVRATRRNTLTLTLVTVGACYFGYHLFVLHHEMMAHGFELTAVPLADRIIGALCGTAE
ncbi:MAG TPA: hypothetical protein VJ840_18655 [Gemmatimonadaceae bacterium]|nr:hypothetical protein [Gemmatimonadaceae bacterium]